MATGARLREFIEPRLTDEEVERVVVRLKETLSARLSPKGDPMHLFDKITSEVRENYDGTAPGMYEVCVRYYPAAEVTV